MINSKKRPREEKDIQLILHNLDTELYFSFKVQNLFSYNNILNLICRILQVIHRNHEPLQLCDAAYCGKHQR